MAGGCVLSTYARRITAFTPIAERPGGDAWLQTAADPTGARSSAR
jgi:hypothetical protein